MGRILPLYETAMTAYREDVCVCLCVTSFGFGGGLPRRAHSI